MPELPFHWLDVFVSAPLTENGLEVVFDAGELGGETMLVSAREMNQTEPGLTKVTVKRDGADWRATMTQHVEPVASEVDPTEIASAVGMPVDALDGDLQILSAGIPVAVAVLGQGHDLADAVPDRESLLELDRRHGIKVVYLMQMTNYLTGEFSYAFARSFTHLVPSLEDAATGSAAGPAAVVIKERLGWEKVEIEQGGQIDRPSVLHTQWTRFGIEVRGAVKPVVRGSALLPG